MGRNIQKRVNNKAIKSTKFDADLIIQKFVHHKQTAAAIDEAKNQEQQKKRWRNEIVKYKMQIKIGLHIIYPAHSSDKQRRMFNIKSSLGIKN